MPLWSFLRRWNRLKQWLPAILWAILISAASTDTFSATHTSYVFIPILQWLFPGASPETLEFLHYLIRKSAHFTEYFVFSLLLFRAVMEREQRWRLRWAVYALAIAAGYSMLDEFHQSFVPSRTASPWDSLLDMTGAAAAQVALGLWAWMRTRRANNDAGLENSENLDSGK